MDKIVVIDKDFCYITYASTIKKQALPDLICFTTAVAFITQEVVNTAMANCLF